MKSDLWGELSSMASYLTGFNKEKACSCILCFFVQYNCCYVSVELLKQRLIMYYSDFIYVQALGSVFYLISCLISTGFE